MLFLTDVDHVSFEKANGTRQNNLQSATVSLQVVMMDSYKGTLESIKKGVLYSKDNGDGDTYSMIPPTEDVVSSYSVDVTKDNGKTVSGAGLCRCDAASRETGKANLCPILSGNEGK